MASIRSLSDQFDPELNDTNLIIAKHNNPDSYRKILLDLIQIPPNLNDVYWISPNMRSSGITVLMKMIILLKKYPILKGTIIEYMKTHPDEIHKVCEPSGWNPLVIATVNYNGATNIESIKLLIQNGSKVNYSLCSSWFPFPPLLPVPPAIIFLFENHTDNVETEIIQLFMNNTNINLNNTCIGRNNALMQCIETYKGKNINDIINILTKPKNLSVENINAAIDLVISKIKYDDNMKEILNIILYNCNKNELNLNTTKTFCHFDEITQNEISNIFESYQYEIQFNNYCCTIC